MDCFITFDVHCSKGHELAKSIGDDSITYRHENAADCEFGEESVTVSKIAPEQLSVLFKPAKKAAAPASKKTASKK